MFGRDRAQQENGSPVAARTRLSRLVAGGWSVIAIINVINASRPAARQASGYHPGSGPFGCACVVRIMPTEMAKNTSAGV